MKPRNPKFMSRKWWNEHWKKEGKRLFGKDKNETKKD